MDIICHTMLGFTFFAYIAYSSLLILLLAACCPPHPLHVSMDVVDVDDDPVDALGAHHLEVLDQP